MNNERFSRYHNGEVISQGQFTNLILSQEAISALTLLTMAYNFPLQDGNAIRIHRHLLHLADAGTNVTVGIDNTYGNRVEPKSDLPIFIARLFGQGKLLDKKNNAYQQLAQHPNVNLGFNGAEHASLFPFRNIDHRKLLLVNESSDPDLAAIFGFNINYQLDTGIIDSALVVRDPDALEWLEQQVETEHFINPTRVGIGDLTFITRELSQDGNILVENEVKQAIDSAAEEILFCGQWLPDGETFDHLYKAAKRGVNVSVFSNLPPLTRQPIYSPFRIKALTNLAQAAKATGNIQFYVPSNPNIFFHIKGLVIDINNPESSVALTGNDNMTNELLQKCGLRDIMVRLDKPELVEEFYKYIQDNIFPNSRSFNLTVLNLRKMIALSLHYE